MRYIFRHFAIQPFATCANAQDYRAYVIPRSKAAQLMIAFLTKSGSRPSAQTQAPQMGESLLPDIMHRNTY